MSIRRLCLAVEASCLSSQHENGGVALYITHLLRRLYKGYAVQAVCFHKTPIGGKALQSLPPGIDFVQSHSPSLIWRNQAITHLAQERGFDDLWFPFHTVPWFSCAPYVVTVHDFGFLRLVGGGGHLFSNLYLSLALVRAMIQSRVVLAVSRSTAEGLTRRFPWAAKKVKVVLHGLPDDVRACSFRKKDWRPHNKELTALFLAGHNSRKRLDLALLACREIQKQQKIKLRITGPKNEIKARCREILGGIPDFVECTGLLTRENLIQLYQQSDLLLYLSHFEGFGFPILEALALGCQVVCLGGAAEKEIGGKAALYAEARPGNVELAILAGQAGSQNPQTVLAGRKHALSFSWEPSVQTHARVFGLQRLMR